MKVVGIVGSTRRGGNTEILTQIALDEIQKEGIETELIRLAEKRIEPCDACRSCTETGKCHIKDDFNAVFTKMKEAEGIIISTPVYYGAATPQIVSLISRFYAARDKATLEIKTLELKKGFKPTREFKEQFPLVLGDFMKFHNAETVKIPENCRQLTKNARLTPG